MSLRRLHLVTGLVMLALFLGTGAWMRLEGMDDVELSTRLFYRSRHLYLLTAALPHLLLSALLPRRPGGLQLLSSVFLCASSPIVFAAFLTEPEKGSVDTVLTSLGLIAAFAGSMGSVLAGWLRASLDYS